MRKIKHNPSTPKTDSEPKPTNTTPPPQLDTTKIDDLDLLDRIS